MVYETKSNDTLSNKQRKCARRARLARNGLCIECGKRKPDLRKKCFYCVYLARVRYRLKYYGKKFGADSKQVVNLKEMQKQLNAGKNIEHIMAVFSDRELETVETKPYTGPKRWFDYLEDEDVAINVPRE